MKLSALTTLAVSALPAICQAAPKAYVYDYSGGNVSVIDANGPRANHHVSNSYGATPGLDGLAIDADHGRVFLAGFAGDFIKSIDISDADTANIPALGQQSSIFAAHPDGKRFLFARSAANNVNEIVMINRETQVITRIALPVRADNGTSALVVLPNGSAAYSVSSAGRVHRLDLTAGTASLAVALPGPGSMLRVLATPDSGALLIGWAASVYRVAVPTHTFTSRTMFANGTAGIPLVRSIALSPDAQTLFVGQQDVGDQTSRGNHRMFRIGAAVAPAAPPAQAAGVHLDGPPLNMAVHPDNSTVYVTHATLQSISVMDGSRMVLDRTIQTGGQPYLVGFVEPVAPIIRASTSFADVPTLITWSEAKSITLADVNGDGREDLCGRVLTGASPGLHCGLSNGNGTFNALSRWTTEFGAAFSASASQSTTLRFPDLNGDGRKDVCGRTTTGLRCGLSNGAGFNNIQTWLPAMADGVNTWQRPEQYETIQYADINGDGSDDVCGRASDGLRCALSNRGNGFGAFVVYSSTFADWNEWNDNASYWSTIKLVKLNNDNFADVCGRSIRGMICELNNGALFTANANPWAAVVGDNTGWNQPQYYRTLQFADMNGDGRQDLCGRGSAGMYCGMSDGVGSFTDLAASVRATNFSDGNGWDAERFYKTIRLTDVDGDGLPDFCGRGSGALICARSLRTANGVIYREAEHRAEGFGDDDGMGVDETFWGTVQPGRVDTLPGTEFCGRKVDGFYCSRF